MVYSIQYTPVGETAAIIGMSLRTALETAADLETKGHKDIVVVDGNGKVLGHDELERLVRSGELSEDA
jgi:hypothetical protein